MAQCQALKVLAGSSDFKALREALSRKAYQHANQLVTGAVKDPQDAAYLRGRIAGLHDAATLPTTITRSFEEKHERDQRAKRRAIQGTRVAHQHLGSPFFWGTKD